MYQIIIEESTTDKAYYGANSRCAPVGDVEVDARDEGCPAIGQCVHLNLGGILHARDPSCHVV